MARWEWRRDASAAAKLVTGGLADGVYAVPLAYKDGVGVGA